MIRRDKEENTRNKKDFLEFEEKKIVKLCAALL